MKSMTGYAFRESQGDGIYGSIEIKGYNSRFLDFSVTLPPLLSSLERWVQGAFAGRVNRGKVEVTVRFKERVTDFSVTVNEGAVSTYKQAFALLAGAFGVKPDISMGTLLRLHGVLRFERERSLERCQQYLEPILNEAVEQFAAEREREGKHTEEDVLKHAAAIEAAVREIAARAPVFEAAIQQNLRARFEEVLGKEVDENRVLAETAALLVKHTISEELSRLDAHLKEFRLETARNPSPGKKLDFLCQEINREVNTIGSKTQELEVSRAVVEMKHSLENIREQLRNVE